MADAIGELKKRRLAVLWSQTKSRCCEYVADRAYIIEMNA